MTDKTQALINFWSSFGIPAYESTNVPNDADFPRLTYDVATSSLDGQIALSASLWYYSTSWRSVTLKADEIGDEIGWGGHMEPYDGGAIWIVRGTPFAQRMDDPEAFVKRIVLNVIAEFLSE